MNITDQKHIADELLRKLEVISPYVILAGGAPRDWLHGYVAKDLDIYLYSCAGTVKAFEKQLHAATGERFNVVRELLDANLYARMPCLRRIAEGIYRGQKVQIMQLQQPGDEFTVVDQMSVSICKVWYKDGQTHRTRDYKISQKSGAMFLSEGYTWDDPHPKKIAERYDNLYRQATFESAWNSLVEKVLGDDE